MAHTKGEWHVNDIDEGVSIRSGERIICEIGTNPSREDLANALRIVTCVSSHDGLVEALGELLNQPNCPGCKTNAKQALAAAK
ncbi:hypothetical protein LCGC14_0346100 [marine sediment metagenome]|uniref:Uncharacterized protein n=1 Tax=marine sediment metagenome TaxID=412755 RepID=A0A0F9WK48_9ZZZZ